MTCACAAFKDIMGQRRLQHRRRLGRRGVLGPHTESKLGSSQCNEHHRFDDSPAVISVISMQLTSFQHGLPFGQFTRPGLISGMDSCMRFRHGVDITQVYTQRYPRVSVASCFTPIHSKPDNLDNCTHHSGTVACIFSLKPPTSH